MPQRAETAIGVDVGGTRIRVARIAADGTVEARASEATDRSRDGFVAQALRLIGDLRDDSTAAVGIGIPGRVDGPAQRILSAGYVDIAGLDLAFLIGAATGLRVRIENDAAAALLAEVAVRRLDGLIAMVTIGTGIGGAVSRHGAPWYGGGFAGQFGHVVVAADGPPCKCGGKGCVETFSSGTALARLVAEAGWPAGTKVEELHGAAAAGRPGAAAILENWAAPLERALRSLVAAINPDLILIGGGLGHAMARALGDRPRASPWFELPLAPATLGDDAGMIGAGLAAMGRGVAA